MDTPGTGASDEEDEQLIQELTDVLKNGAVGHTNSILLLLDGRETRFDKNLQSMLRQMSYLFGEQWWELMTIGVSFWSYDQWSTDNRNERSTNYPSNSDDPVQHSHWHQETQKLWDIMSSLETPVEFQTRNDMSKENKKFKEEIKWLKEHCICSLIDI